MRFSLRVLMLVAIGVPQGLIAQAPRTVTSVVQASADSSPAPQSLRLSERAQDSAELDLRQTAKFLNSTNFRTDLGRYVLFGANKDGKTFSAIPSGEHSLALVNTAAVKTAFRPQSEIAKPLKKHWISLLIVEHGAAVFDAWSTRDIIQNSGAHELNPLFRPFASSNMIYVATQAGPGLFDYVGYRMMKSKKSWVRKLWWLPQVAGTAASLFSGAHNLTVSQARPSNPAP